MRLVCISDTHNQHDQLDVPNGDVLIHAGDWTGTGTQKQVISFIRWFANQPHKHKVLIAGNHEVTLDQPFYDIYWNNFHNKYPLGAHLIKDYVLRESGIHYLENTEVIIDGVKFYGSPAQPAFGCWAFGFDRGSQIQSLWSKIPDDTDVLITHGPPYGYGDMLDIGDHVGCKDLLKVVQDRVKPKVHVYGHIHEGYGVYDLGDTKLINAASCDEHYQMNNPPIIFDLGGLS